MEVLPRLAEEGVRVDSCITDPPYHLTSIVKRFGKPDSAAVKVPENGTGVYARGSKGFMGKQWDGGDIAFQPETWAAVMAVMKPGAHLLAFGGTRTYARMAVAIEDAGFEVRDTVAWLYGSGFPKSHDVGKGIDKAAGAERETIGLESMVFTAPATPEAQRWNGWGTALKPAMELICLARKPLSEGTVAKNVVLHGTGAINVDGCRIGTDEGAEDDGRSAIGRWPANLAHDGSEEVLAGFPQTDSQPGGNRGTSQIWGGAHGDQQCNGYNASGSAARFFYTSKASPSEREGSKHPTVKPLDLMRWLVRLITPPGGTILDPFAGSGTTGVAAVCEGFDAILIEREPEYLKDIERRISAARGEPQGTEAEPGLFA